jgi:hypothetical protein
VQQVGHARAQDAEEVDAAVFVEAVVLDREHRLLHHVGMSWKRTSLRRSSPNFADQHVIGGIDAQRHLRR